MNEKFRNFRKLFLISSEKNGYSSMKAREKLKIIDNYNIFIID